MLQVTLPSCEADVMANMDKLKVKDLPLTDRELAILSVAVTELQAAGYFPFEEMFMIQVDTCLCTSNFHISSPI